MSCALLILALMIASGTSLPLDLVDENADTIFAADSSSNSVESRIEILKKLARTNSAEVSGDDNSNEMEGTSISGESEREASRVSTTKDELYGRSAKKGRKHKAFYINYPFVPQVQRYRKAPSHETSLKSFKNEPTEKRKSGYKKRVQQQQQQQESQIYYIRLPPTPYMYVPGLGYISQPPTYSTAGLQRPSISHAQRPPRPQNMYHRPAINPFINVPIDFVSNGKPTGVYQYPGSKRPESTLNSLNQGPYVFNGKPTSLYLLNADGTQTGNQPIRLADYSKNEYY